MNDVMLNKISQFLSKEFLQNMSNISMIQNNDGSYEFFNRYTVHQVKTGYEVHLKYNSDVKMFSSLKNALTWCIFENRTKFTQARRIEYLDNMLAGTEVSIEVHKNLIKKTSNTDNQLIYIAKLSEEQAKRKQMILELASFVNESKNWQTRKFVAKR
jgi:hypothetical protein